MSSHRRLACLPICAVLFSVPALGQQVDYAKAEILLSWHASQLVFGDEVDPQWLVDGNRFWYRNKTGTGHEFVMVDPVGNTRGTVFDHDRLAAAMSLANDSAYAGRKLPFDSFDFLGGEEAIAFRVGRKRFECNISRYACIVADTLPSTVPYVVSPDSAWEAFVQGYDLYIRPHGGGDTVRLTSDGEEFYSYGLDYPSPNQVRSGAQRRPAVSWSPDSRRLVVDRRDERGVEHHHYISYTPQRPVHYSQPYALPGDTVFSRPGMEIIDVETRNKVKVELDSRSTRSSFRGSSIDSAWTGDSRAFYVVYGTRASKHAFLAEVEAATGALRILAGDSSQTFVETNQRDPISWYVTGDGQNTFWWSERDGWAHIWRYDGDGNVRNQVTSGPWAVGAIQYVDEPNQRLYFTARGRDGEVPYYARLYRVNFDGGGLVLLTPEDANHEISFAPSGRFFVDTYSRIEAPPVTLLRAAPDGRVLRTLEEADVSGLVEAGWHPSQVFKVKARDGITDIWGVIDFPSDFDPANVNGYPIISHIYPGPQVGSVGNWGFKAGGRDAALAQLGFVVVQIDHMGTPLRSKAFHDNYYGNFIDNGIPDHIAAIKQLGARYPAVDLDRVGIFGGSGGGFASTDAILRYPDFFKVAVSRSGNHDNASYNIGWAEKYQGLLVRDTLTGSDNFRASANKTYAANLKGKLLLIHGDLDDNVHPAMTIQLIDELIKANKDFDFIWGPDYPHGMLTPYFVRKRWDYFVRHLLGVEPPADYEIKRPVN
jgi:dipeptidyl aminopeptidase/acylaminoacyl peptidase